MFKIICVLFVSSLPFSVNYGDYEDTIDDTDFYSYYESSSPVDTIDTPITRVRRYGGPVKTLNPKEIREIPGAVNELLGNKVDYPLTPSITTTNSNEDSTFVEGTTVDNTANEQYPEQTKYEYEKINENFLEENNEITEPDIIGATPIPTRTKPSSVYTEKDLLRQNEDTSLTEDKSESKVPERSEVESTTSAEKETIKSESIKPSEDDTTKPVTDVPTAPETKISKLEITTEQEHPTEKTTQPTTESTATTTLSTTTTQYRTPRTTTKRTPAFDVPALLDIIANLTYDYETNLTFNLNETLKKMSIPTCGTPTTTTIETTMMELEGNDTGAIVAKCFVCGLEVEAIPHHARCADAFAGDFLPLVPVDPTAKGQISKFRKYCRYYDVNHYLTNASDPRSVYGRWSGGCSVRWTDLSGVYTQRSCRNRYRAIMGRHYASKRMAKLEMALTHVENGCIISPMATLLPLSRGISLYARFHACVCTGNWCNRSVRLNSNFNMQIIVGFVVLYSGFI